VTSNAVFGLTPRKITESLQFRILDRRPTQVARPSHVRNTEMTILCAWCCHEGQPGYMGEREPLDNPAPTHGVCSYHKAQVLESLYRETIATGIQGHSRGSSDL